MTGASDFYKHLPYISDNDNDVSSVSNPCTYAQQQTQFQEFYSQSFLHSLSLVAQLSLPGNEFSRYIS